MLMKGRNSSEIQVCSYLRSSRSGYTILGRGVLTAIRKQRKKELSEDL